MSENDQNKLFSAINACRTEIIIAMVSEGENPLPNIRILKQAADNLSAACKDIIDKELI